NVFAGGSAAASYDVPCAKAWDYERALDATIEAMRTARLVIATDAGLAHLTMLCGVPLLMIAHAEGLVAPGPAADETGRVMDEEYWPIKIDRYREGNHTGAPLEVVNHGWLEPDRVLRRALATLHTRVA